MGSTAQDLKAKKGNGRGSVNNAGRLAKFGKALETRGGSADWGAVDGRWLAAITVAATSQGMEVAFGLSKDGGAYSLKLYDFSSGERVQLWFNQDADLEKELAAVYETLNAD